jgi:nitrogen fixation NifU-like protein
MGGLDDLYKEIILDHYRSPRGEGEIENATVSVDQNNPMCGDEIHLALRIEDDRLVELGHTGHGCSISRASASMMSELAPGTRVDEALDLVEHFRLVMHSETEPDAARLKDAVALEGVQKFPARIKCALLGWMALKDALQIHRDGSE